MRPSSLAALAPFASSWSRSRHCRWAAPTRSPPRPAAARRAARAGRGAPGGRPEQRRRRPEQRRCRPQHQRRRLQQRRPDDRRGADHRRRSEHQRRRWPEHQRRRRSEHQRRPEHQRRSEHQRRRSGHRRRIRAAPATTAAPAGRAAAVRATARARRSSTPATTTSTASSTTTASAFAIRAMWPATTTAASSIRSESRSTTTTRTASSAALATTTVTARARAARRRANPVELDLLSGDDAVGAGPPGVELEHVLRRAAHRERVVAHRRGVLLDPDDHPVVVDEEHVERDAGVVHPEGVIVLLGEGENHPPLLAHLGSVHQAALPIVIVLGDLDCRHRRALGLAEHHLAGAQLRRRLGIVGAARVGAVRRGALRLDRRPGDAAPGRERVGAGSGRDTGDRRGRREGSSPTTDLRPRRRRLLDGALARGDEDRGGANRRGGEGSD